jgi:hypothetical protein
MAISVIATRTPHASSTGDWRSIIRLEVPHVLDRAMYFGWLAWLTGILVLFAVVLGSVALRRPHATVGASRTPGLAATLRSQGQPLHGQRTVIHTLQPTAPSTLAPEHAHRIIRARRGAGSRPPDPGSQRVTALAVPSTVWALLDPGHSGTC